MHGKLVPSLCDHKFYKNSIIIETNKIFQRKDPKYNILIGFFLMSDNIFAEYVFSSIESQKL